MDRAGRMNRVGLQLTTVSGGAVLNSRQGVTERVELRRAGPVLQAVAGQAVSVAAAPG